MAEKKTMAEKKMGTNSSATQRTFPVVSENQSGPIQGGCLIEGDRILSLGNRRLYRQHRTYRMKINLISATAPQGDIPVYALMNNWYNRKALSTAKEMFDYAVSEERAVVGSSRWNDFRIKPELFASGAGSNAPTGFPQVLDFGGLNPTVIDYGVAGTGEYNYSEVEVGGTATRFSLGIPTASGVYNVFEEFNKMGPNPPESPTGAITGGYDLVDATFEKEEVQELLNKGNLPPYEANLTSVTPQVWVLVGTLGVSGTGDLRTTTGFFDAPLGTVWIPGSTWPFAGDKPQLEVEYAAGDYKGVLSADI